MVERLNYDSVIIGGGVAGLRAAIEIGSSSKVLVVSKVHPMRSNSVSAQGGINAAISSEDSWQRHMEDTVRGGAFLNDQDAVEILCKNAGSAIEELDKMGVFFSRNKDGKISQRRFGAQTEERTCHASDKTGQTILGTLYWQAKKKSISFLDEVYVLKVVIENNVCKGIICIDIKTGEILVINSKSTLIASGGYARLYGVSSNNQTNTGDMHALMLREGVPLQDMEFVQFHPTGLFPSGILIGEAARAYGGMMVNEKGERFMQRYDDRMELASRDVISKAMYKEIKSGRGIKQNAYLNLDMTKIDNDIIDRDLPQIRDIAKTFAGVDVKTQPLPVQPTAHYSMGGIPVDKTCRVQALGGSVVGLYAAGECSCLSVHGANRVGGNSLLETVVFGRVAGKEMGIHNLRTHPTIINDAMLKEQLVYVGNLRKKNGTEKLFSLRTELATMMDNLVGVVRDQRGLSNARDQVKELRKRYEHIGLQDQGKVFNTELLEAIELRNMLDVAEAVIMSALSRKESLGAHQRSDYPHATKQYQHTLAYREGGMINIEMKNVLMKSVQPS